MDKTFLRNNGTTWHEQTDLVKTEKQIDLDLPRTHFVMFPEEDAGEPASSQPSTLFADADLLTDDVKAKMKRVLLAYSALPNSYGYLQGRRDCVDMILEEDYGSSISLANNFAETNHDRTASNRISSRGNNNTVGVVVPTGCLFKVKIP